MNEFNNIYPEIQELSLHLITELNWADTHRILPSNWSFKTLRYAPGQSASKYFDRRIVTSKEPLILCVNNIYDIDWLELLYNKRPTGASTYIIDKNDHIISMHDLINALEQV